MMLKSQLFLAALTLSATTAFAQGLPETNGDPANDTIAGAEAGACGSQHYGSISVSGDDDVWCFTVAATSSVTVWTSQRGSAFINDTLVDIFDSVGATIVTNDDGGEALMSLATAVLTPGTYYVNVRGFSSNVGDYAFDILCEPAGGALAEAPAEVEPNNSCATGTLANCNENHRNTLTSGGDSDFYCLTLGSAQTVTFETHSDITTTGIARSDTEIWLYDSACVEIGNDDDGGAGLLSKLTQALGTGTYYLEVASWNRGTTAGDYRLSITCTGGALIPATQTLTNLLSPPTDLCAGGYNAGAAEVEPNNSCATAGVTNCCDEHLGTIAVAGDDDYYCITLGAAAIVTFETHENTASANNIGDTELFLYDSNCSLIAANDDGGAGFYSLISIALDAGTYYIAVEGWNDGNSGDYRLTVDCVVPDPGCAGTSGDPMAWDLRVGELARFGSQWTTDLVDIPGAAVVLLSTSGSAPLSLSIVGAPGCYLGVGPVIASLPVTPTAPGEGEFGIGFGFFPGVSFHLQAAAIDFGANALNVILTEDVAVATIGNS